MLGRIHQPAVTAGKIKKDGPDGLWRVKMRSLDEIKTAMKDPKMKEDSTFFHAVMEEMLGELGFTPTERGYALHTPELGDFPGIIYTRRLQDVENAAKIHEISDFAYQMIYEKGDTVVTVLANHRSLGHLRGNIMHQATIASNSKLGIERPVKQVEEPQNVDLQENPIFAAWEHGCIAKVVGEYIISPEMIYELIENQDS